MRCAFHRREDDEARRDGQAVPERRLQIPGNGFRTRSRSGLSSRSSLCKTTRLRALLVARICWETMSDRTQLSSPGPAVVTVVGGGLAGSEAAWQLARRGVPVRLYEMRPVRETEAHSTQWLGELVCSN